VLCSSITSILTGTPWDVRLDRGLVEGMVVLSVVLDLGYHEPAFHWVGSVGPEAGSCGIGPKSRGRGALCFAPRRGKGRRGRMVVPFPPRGGGGGILGGGADGA
jgi:hypothetical protein